MTRERVQKSGRAGTTLVVRIVGGGVAVGSMIAIVGTTGVASAAPEKVHKSYVCKYVSKPGEAERLQTGQNPIWVDNHSLFRSPEAYNAAGGLTHVGQQFNDGQFRSVVIVANTPKLNPEPGVEACAAPTTPPTTPPPSTPPTSTTSKTSTTSTTSTSSTSSTSSSSSTTTGSSGTTTSSAAPVSTATTYPLQPVNAGVTSDTGNEPNKAGWLAAALLGLLALATGGRLPRVMRKGTRSE